MIRARTRRQRSAKLRLAGGLAGVLAVVGALVGVLIAVWKSAQPPADMVHLVDPSHADGGFSIDRYEFPNTAGIMPRHTTSAIDARQACASVGKRLCTAAEWRRACAGPDGSLRFGYGADFRHKACHTEVHVPSGHTSMMNPGELLIPAGQRSTCATPEGVFDLVGNLEEWVLDDAPGGVRLEGGAWYTYSRYADCTGNYSRAPDYRLSPDREVYSAGIRCCWSDSAPSPESISADHDRRLAAAAAADSALAYDPEPENHLGDGVFMDTWEYPNRPGERPRVAVTWTEASDLCETAGKRLCTTREWETACSDPDAPPPPAWASLLEGACPVELEGPQPSGGRPACAAESGVHDLIGSVWEWTADTVDAPVLVSDDAVVLREVRGGSWLSDPRKATCRPFDGYPAAPQDAAFSRVGFRCCRGTPQPVVRTAMEPRVACPDDMRAVGGFCIEALEYPGVAGQPPEGGLSFGDAHSACAARGRRLCAQSEWMRACGGSPHQRWPYGDIFVLGACHDDAETTVDRLVASAPVGSHPDCVTPEGVADLSGNLWEWVQLDHTEDRGVALGGGWTLSAGLNQCRAEARGTASHGEARLGTRCCLDGTALDDGGRQ